MYDYIKGVLVSQKNLPTGSSVTVEANGIGYLLKTTQRTINELPEKNSEIKVYVSLVHKEDSMSLCGFLHKEERDLFEILQTVSGVGIKAALTIIDEFSVAELVGIMINEDYKELSRAKGIGQKSAQKIVLELKDKLLARQEDLLQISGESPKNEPACTLEVKNVLFSLGYSKEEIDNSLKYALGIPNIKLNSEEILKMSLQYLAQQ
ncbi:MAG: Holliday junction branch migration protein RuvA [Candidatus Gastranaerophilales bacterium]|nr:Holliday junction branch migration protein RuvA [Candidatus Gastranaerophilales bacterium]